MKLAEFQKHAPALGTAIGCGLAIILFALMLSAVVIVLIMLLAIA